MKSNIVIIVGAIVDHEQLTLYKEDGSTIQYMQGDKRIQPILDDITVPLVQDKRVSLDLTKYHYVDKVYDEFSANTNGVVKFFRVAKKIITDLFSEGKKISDLQIGITEIMANAKDTAEPMKESDTVVATIGNTIIPDAHKIRSQFERANNLGSTQGVQRFLERIQKVIGERRHSVEDLLSFMERGDLPIADDGSIIIFKVLRKEGDHYVDCHTRKVIQKIGSYVCMDPSLVDHDRRKECSNGLHVARRDYIRNFSGDVCVLGKVAPEDVIAVPEEDPNKMRVCGYHILFELPMSDYVKVKNRESFTDNDLSKGLLGKAISGDHVGVLETVVIKGHLGTDIVITSLVQDTKTELEKVKVQDDAPKAETLPEPGKEDVAPAVDPLAVSDKVSAIKSRKDHLQDLVAKLPDANAAEEIRTIKRKSKKSYAALGISEEVVKLIES